MKLSTEQVVLLFLEEETTEMPMQVELSFHFLYMETKIQQRLETWIYFSTEEVIYVPRKFQISFCYSKFRQTEFIDKQSPLACLRAPYKADPTKNDKSRALVSVASESRHREENLFFVVSLP